MFFRLSAQEKGSQVDSLVRLLSAQSMELIEKDGVDYRKVTGPARFLHNDTFSFEIPRSGMCGPMNFRYQQCENPSGPDGSDR